MQTKLTLRVEAAVVRKAKHLAQKRGSSVSKIFSEFIAKEKGDEVPLDLGEVTASMVGVLSGSEVSDERKAYHSHLEDKYL